MKNWKECGILIYSAGQGLILVQNSKEDVEEEPQSQGIAFQWQQEEE